MYDRAVRAIPALVRSLIFCASSFANDESNASRTFRASSLSVDRCSLQQLGNYEGPEDPNTSLDTLAFLDR
jgi:hypothetical protein